MEGFVSCEDGEGGLGDAGFTEDCDDERSKEHLGIGDDDVRTLKATKDRR